MFQYHSGPIKSIDIDIEGIAGLTGFNTTLVQLKDAGTKSNVRLCVGFNTTLVQLKEPICVVTRVWVQKFQYHSGPIKRGFVVGMIALQILSFNTTLVQLKDTHASKICSVAKKVSIPLWSN